MTEAIQEIFKNIFGSNVVLATILIAMLPIIELRGAIPFGMSKDIWGKLALSSWESFGWSLLGSCLIVPILALLLKPILKWLKGTKIFRKVAIWFENLIASKSVSINKKLSVEQNKNNEVVKLDENDDKDKLTNNADLQKQNRYNKQFFIKFFGVMMFVAIPLPLTGVWTGTAIAVMLNMEFGWACLSVIAGNIIAGLIMMTLCVIFPNFTLYILLIFIALTIIFLLYKLIKNKIKKHNNNQ